MAPLPEMEVDWPDATAADDQEGALPGTASASPAVTAVESDDEALADAQADRRYDVRIDGLTGEDGVSPEADASIRARFKSLSALEEGKGTGNTAQIDRRARQDEALLGELLRTAGYYDASVVTRIEGQRGERLSVILRVRAGTIYTLSTVDMPGLTETGALSDELREAFALRPGDPADSDKIAVGLAALKTSLGQRGLVFAKVGEPKLTIDHEENRAALSVDVDPGRVQRIGEIRVDGRQLFSARHLGRIARFRRGDIYDATKMEDFRRALIQTSLVSTVSIKPVATPDPEVVDIVVKLDQAPPRTISGAIGYGTGEGYRVEASWQHRNLIRPEGAVTFRGVLGTQEQSLGATLRRNNFKTRDRVLTGQLVVSHLDQNAYEARSVTLGAGLERQTNIIWQKKWTWSYGVELVASKEDDTVKATGAPRRRQYLIGALPSSLSYDGSDDLLNPTRGFRLAARVSPEASLQGSAFGYFKGQLDGSSYMPVSDRIVLAGRVRLGAIWGASAERIAPTRRFLCGRWRLGARLWLSEDRPGRHQRRSGRRPQSGRVLDRGPHPLRRFRGGALLRRRQSLCRQASDLPQPALRRRSGRALLHQLRSDPCRCRHADQPAGRGLARGGLCVARTGLLMSVDRELVENVEERVLAWRQRHPVLRAVAIVLLALSLVLSAAIWMLDSAPGHRLIADRVGALRPSSGLRIHVGRIDGSIWNRATIRDFRLYDDRGLFLEAPELAVDWRPAAWIANKLWIRRATTDLLILHRKPALRPSTRKGPLLPGFDIHVGKLEVRKLRLEPPVAGRLYLMTLDAGADIHAGRVLLQLNARSNAADRIALQLDSQPDRNLFDLDARIEGPASGVIASLTGWKQPVDGVVSGSGTWSAWQGRATLDAGETRLIELALRANKGRYALEGFLAPSRFPQRQAAAAQRPADPDKGRCRDGRPPPRRARVDPHAVARLRHQRGGRSRRKCIRRRAGEGLAAPPAGPVPQHDRAEYRARRALRRALRHGGL